MLLGIKLFLNYRFNPQRLRDTKLPLIKFIGLTLVSMLLFFTEIPLIFSIVPFSCGLSFYYLFIYFTYKYTAKNNFFEQITSSFGKYSMTIFITQALFVYGLPVAIFKFNRFFDIHINETVLYLMYILPVFVFCYFCGKYYNILLVKPLTNTFKKRLIKTTA